jgi:hypothetical protein
MACFVTPAAVAIATTLNKKKFDPKLKIDWLNNMLWGGVLMLVVEHIASGEIILIPPFLTAMSNAEEISTMLKEMATIGGAMTIAIFFVWVALVVVFNNYKKVQGTENLS